MFWNALDKKHRHTFRACHKMHVTYQEVIIYHFTFSIPDTSLHIPSHLWNSMPPLTPDRLGLASISSLWLSDRMKPEGRAGNIEPNSRLIGKSESTLKQVEAGAGMIFWQRKTVEEFTRALRHLYLVDWWGQHSRSEICRELNRRKASRKEQSLKLYPTRRGRQKVGGSRVEGP